MKWTLQLVKWMDDQWVEGEMGKLMQRMQEKRWKGLKIKKKEEEGKEKREGEEEWMEIAKKMSKSHWVGTKNAYHQQC